MRIAFIPLVFLPRYTGGGEVWMSGIARELHRQGHHVSVLTAEDSACRTPEHAPDVLIRDDEWAGLPVRRLYYDKSKTGRPAPWYDTINPSVEQAVTAFLEEQRPDIVHLTCGQHLSASPILAAKSLGLPVVLTLIGFWYICPLTTLLRPDGSLCDGRKEGYECLSCLAQSSRVAALLQRMPAPILKIASSANLALDMFTRNNSALTIMSAVDNRNKVFADVFRRVDRVLAPSTALRNLFIKSGLVAPNQILFWQYSVDVRHAELNSQKNESSVLRLGYTGHIYRQKGIDILIKAVLGLPREFPIQLRIYGSVNEKDKEYGRELHALANRDERIQFLGRYENNQLGGILREIDVVVAPSLWIENSPVAVHEALAAHTPVIASNLGGVTDLVIHNYNGLLFERGNEQDLASQVSRLITESSLLARLTNHARAIRGIEDEATELEKLYTEILSRQRVEA